MKRDQQQIERGALLIGAIILFLFWATMCGGNKSDAYIDKVFTGTERSARP